MSDKQNESFAAMYCKMDIPSTPEKVSGVPVARSSRELLEKLKEQDEQS